MTLSNLGKFGRLVKNYEKARTGYDPRIFEYIKKLIRIKDPLILDIGCGTGISTRQLATIGTVIGCDKDPVMINAAKKHKNSRVKDYVIGIAKKLPFKDETFNAVTAFTSFHWFYDSKESIKEIKRVLKPEGLFIVVSKSGVKGTLGYKDIITQITKRSVPSFGNVGYDPKKSMMVSGFKKIHSKRWKGSEFYTLEKALQYVQSLSIWNSVSEKLRPRVLKNLKIHFKDLTQRKGRIERKFTSKVVSGKK